VDDHDKVLEKSVDDNEFLRNYGSLRSKVPNDAYRNGYDLIDWKRQAASTNRGSNEEILK